MITKYKDVYSIDNVIKSKNITLKILSFFVLVIDVFIFALSIIGGLNIAYIIGLLILSVIDGLTIVFINNSCFRFKYSKSIIVLYIIFVLLALGFIWYLGKDTFSTTAIVLYCLLHLFYIIGSIFNNKSVNTSNKLVKALSFVVVCITIVFSTGYAGFVLGSGFFGQGRVNYRALKYEYNETNDTYSVVGLEQGSGDTVIIPNSFNDKLVSKVDVAIFADSNLKQIILQSGSNINYYTSSTTGDIQASIYVSKDQVGDYNKAFAQLVKQNRYQFMIDIYNSVVPYGLEEDEVYVSFNYTLDSIDDSDYNVITTWIGDKGDTFRLSEEYPSLLYTADYDIYNEQFLYTNYLNNGKVVCILDDTNTSIEANQITESKEVNVSFEQVYRVSIADSNDSIYNTQHATQEATFKSFNNTGYRYVIKGSNLLNTKESRDGFDLTWKYSKGYSSTKYDVVSLDSILSSSSVKLYPIWTMVKPTIDIRTNISGSSVNMTTFTYGDSVVVSNREAKASTDFVYSYSWTTPSSTKTTSSFTNTKITPSDSGSYQVTINCTSPNSSLSSTATGSVNLTINKKQIDFAWLVNGGTTNVFTYDGNSKTITSTVSSDIVSGDNIQYTQSISSVKDANTYTAQITLSGTTNDNYVVGDTTKQYTVTINKRDISEAIVTLGTSLVYNGDAQTQTISSVVASGVSVDTYTTTGNKNTNANDYTLTITGTGNFTGSKSVAYSIGKKEITAITWDTNNFVYNASTQYPKVTSVTGCLSKDTTTLLNSIQYSSSSKGVDAGNYTCEITSCNSNYYISAVKTYDYTIDRRPIQTATVTLGASLVYNGTEQTQTISSVMASGVSVDTYTTTGNKNTNAGDYILTITGTVNFTGSITKEYSISQLDISSATVTLGTALVYNGAEQTQTISSVVASGVNVTTYTTTGNKNTDAGTYTLTITGTGNFTGNVTKKYSISKLNISNATVTLDTTQLVYNGTEQEKTISSVVASGFNVTTYTTTGNKNTNAGEYTLTITGTGNFTGSKSVSYSIGKKEITAITWDTNNFVYNASTQYPKVTSAIGCLSKDTTTLLNSIQYSSKGVDAGNYTCEITSCNSNYYISAVKTYDYTIEQRSIQDATVTLGTSLVYNGAEQTQTISNVVAGGVSVDTYTTTGNKNTNVGNYTLTITGTGNFTGSVTKEYSISQLDISSAIVTLGTALVYNGTEQIQTISSVVASGVNVTTYTTTGNKNTDAGTYTLTITGTDNFTGNVTKKYSISRLNISDDAIVTLDTTQLVYNGTEQEKTISSVVASGFNVTTYTTTGNKNTNAGDYTLTVTGTGNFTGSKSVSYSISQKSINVQWNNLSKVYDGEAFAPQATITGLESVDTVEYEYYQDTLKLSTNPIAVGEYTVKLIVSDNYSVVGNVQATFSIEAIEG